MARVPDQRRMKFRSSVRAWHLGWLLACGVLGAIRLAAETFAAEKARLESQLAAKPDDAATLIALGKLCHNESTLGQNDAKATAKLANDYLSRALKLQPTNAFARAMLGSTITLGARDAFVFKAMKLVKQGLGEMDAAVQMAPDDANVRFTRCANNVFLPDYFKRREIVLQDFAWLTEQTTKAPEKFEAEFRQYVALYHGMARKRYGELDKAAELWQAGVAIAPGTPVAEQIRKRLNPPAKS
jgi:tetratricopeptide (TPR) repeat protein